MYEDYFWRQCVEKNAVVEKIQVANTQIGTLIEVNSVYRILIIL